MDNDKPLIDQLMFIPVEVKIVETDPITPEIIAQRSKEIRDTWDEATEQSRSTKPRVECRIESFSIREILEHH